MWLLIYLCLLGQLLSRISCNKGFGFNDIESMIFSLFDTRSTGVFLYSTQDPLGLTSRAIGSLAAAIQKLHEAVITPMMADVGAWLVAGLV
ncbi:hypothetical protein HanIR_Chr03g0128511 [Helianthus annuus]|nr:hypothetical protein HanIR_Chr03g0128511 [Helianthus annuus]